LYGCKEKRGYRKLKKEAVDRNSGELALEEEMTCSKADNRMNDYKSG
jgi:hypothetical protein